MGLNLNKTKVEENVQAEVNTAPAAEVNEEVMAEDDMPKNSPEGTNSLRDKVAFVQPITTPLRDDVTKVKFPDGHEETKHTPFIIGYQFKALIDLVVPECGITPNFKKNYMDYKDINGKREVKAGEIFNCTPFETALMASWAEFNTMFTGGEHTAVCAFSRRILESKNGGADKVIVKDFPRAVLRLTKGSIKDIGYVNAFEKQVVMGEDGRERRTGTVVAGFEKWEPMLQATTRSGARGASGARASKVEYDPAARMFQELARGKGYQR